MNIADPAHLANYLIRLACLKLILSTVKKKNYPCLIKYSALGSMTTKFTYFKVLSEFVVRK